MKKENFLLLPRAPLLHLMGVIAIMFIELRLDLPPPARVEVVTNHLSKYLLSIQCNIQ